MQTMDPIPKSFRDSTAVAFPKGWYCVAESSEVLADAMLPVSLFERQLVVYRDAAGTAQVSDAYCPHLGAHLASADGCIEDGELVCPFHKWRFDGASGACTSIPYSEKVPPGAKLMMFPTLEINGVVFLWWHPDGGEPEAPPYDPFAVHADKPWIHHSARTFLTQVPLRDLHENAFDTAHIQQLHRGVTVPEIESIERRPFGLEVTAAPPAAEENSSIWYSQFNFSYMGMVSHVIFGDGFGFLQYNSSTPIDRENTLMHIRMYILDTGSAEMNASIGSAFADRVQFEIDQDMKVLNFKRHVERPVLCQGDGPIMKWRKYVDELLKG
jgi:3-ketosteroid 9alpha-monooxygenase subunit A